MPEEIRGELQSPPPPPQRSKAAQFGFWTLIFILFLLSAGGLAFGFLGFSQARSVPQDEEEKETLKELGQISEITTELKKIVSAHNQTQISADDLKKLQDEVSLLDKKVVQLPPDVTVPQVYKQENRIESLENQNKDFDKRLTILETAKAMPPDYSQLEESITDIVNKAVRKLKNGMEKPSPNPVSMSPAQTIKAWGFGPYKVETAK